jgi:Tfp pilus assembly protein PilN
MARLRWNFASPRFRTLPWSAACIIAFAGTVHALYWRDALLQQRERLVESERETLGAMTQKRRWPVAPSPTAERVFEEMRYPWTDVLQSLQSATNPDLDLLELSPDSADIRRVQVQGIADQAQNVFDLITRLQKDPSWTSVQLVSLTKTDVDGVSLVKGAANPILPSVTSRSIAFALVAQWRRP